MSDILPFLPVALLVLACPLGMAVLGVGAWMVARARGEKKELSMGCIGSHGEHQQQPATEASENKLTQQVARLEQEVQGLRTQVKATGDGAVSAAESGAPTVPRS